MIIYLIRHARPHGVEGICYGRRDVSVPASETESAARALRLHMPEEVLRSADVYSSPLVRCSLLARAIADGRPVTETPALLELDFGTWQGSSWDDIPRDELDAWAADLWHYAPGRGESAAAAARRWRAWVEALPKPSPAVIAVSHAGVIRVAHADLTMAVEYGSVHRIEA
jgi:alpha-ribazole phosphatase